MSTPKHFTVTVTAQITNQMIVDQLVAAFEGGSNYWMGGTRVVAPSDHGFDSASLARGLGLSDTTGYTLRYLLPLVGGCGVQISLDDEGQENGDDPPRLLNRESIQAGLEWLAHDCPDRLREIIEENGDAETADVFLQACVFGEIVYG